ncbi:DUF222 domain-containing protein [Kutzneria sp. NPDC051319]|uniref:DUF222 domain-containing protein n=1 Tax=Kutzneria sp. NPDC051319 TaxID=3155047 RepID=UPI0034275845
MNEKVARLIECERRRRQLSAEVLHLTAELCIDEEAPVDIGAALQLSPVNAQDHCEFATRLESLFPNVIDAMAAGTISERSAHAIVDPTEFYPEDLAQRAVTKTLETAEGRCPQQLRRSCQARLQRADPAVHLERREKARRDRKVVLYDDEDSMATLACQQPAEIAQAMYAKIDRIAKQEPKNGRTIDAVRADVMAGLILEDPKTAGLKPLIQVTVPITALLGVDDRPGKMVAGQLIPAAVVRELMSHPGTLFHRLLTDPAGHLVEYTPKLYRPKVGVDRFIRTRHQTCVMPCCSHPSRSCDIDHATPWPLGESTSTNLAPLDRRHYRYKHATKAEVSIAEDGTATVKTRWGQTYVTKPAPLDEPPF